MKKMYTKILLFVCFLPLSILAQNGISGVVSDSKTKQPIPGVNIIIKGTSQGVQTDFDGKFQLPIAKKGDELVFSYLGYKNKTVAVGAQSTITVSLEEDSNELKEVVVQVGYGSVKKKDATGSVALITAKDFNRGAIVSTDQLLAGKAAGVRITNTGGSPDSAPNIRIRGGASLNASNNPLIIIDGVPIGDLNPAGVNNPLSLVNPNDVESFSILKDASATAIYGIRASNGVILITTKKGSSGAPQYSFSSNFSIGKVNRTLDVMDSNEFSEFIRNRFPDKTALLGVDDPSNELTDNPATPEIEGRILYNTNWQDQIFRTTLSTDNNFSVRANLYKKIPFRFSLGYNNTQGLIKTNTYERLSYSIKMTPKFLDDNLKVDLNLKGTVVDKNNVDEDGALGSVISMDPTKPVYGNSPDNRFVGYYQEIRRDGNFDKKVGATNPLAILEQRTRPERALRLLGNIEFEYKIPLIKGLKAVANFGLDATASTIKETFAANSLNTYTFNQGTDPNTNYLFNPGLSFSEKQTSTNTTMDTYLVYSKNLTGFVSKFDLQAGYSYQDFKTDGNKKEFRNNITSGLREPNINPNNPDNRYFSPLNFQAFFARTNVDLAGKYLFTATMRADATSLFVKENKWGYFPAAGFAWKIKEESFLKDIASIQDLKLRLGWGKTGQASIKDKFFPSQLLFQPGNQTSQYLPGSNTYTALPYLESLTWEKTTTNNIGLDFEFFKKGVLSGSLDLYTRKTNDLLADVTFAAGSTAAGVFIKNIGSLESKGAELYLNVKILDTDNFSSTISGNLAYNINEVTDLGGISVTDASESGISGTGVKLAYHNVGFQSYSAWVFEQVYDANGQPIVGAFVDRDGVNGITNADRYYVPLRPNYTYGFGTAFRYKNWDLAANFRGQIGGQMYNLKRAENGSEVAAVPQNGNSLNNILSYQSGAASPLFKDFIGNKQFSDYLLEDASFLRCDNVSLAYKFEKFVNKSSLRVSASANNLFILTKYSGQDPENFDAIDRKFYPRPTILTLGLNLEF